MISNSEFLSSKGGLEGMGALHEWVWALIHRWVQYSYKKPMMTTSFYTFLCQICIVHPIFKTWFCPRKLQHAAINLHICIRPMNLWWCTQIAECSPVYVNSMSARYWFSSPHWACMTQCFFNLAYWASVSNLGVLLVPISF